MAMPAMPNEEVFNYSREQEIAGHLAAKNAPLLDGGISHSVQMKDGHNVVLFRKAAPIEVMGHLKETEIEAHTGYGIKDGWEVDYTSGRKRAASSHVAARGGSR